MDEGLTDEERARLREAEAAPPPALEDRIVGALHAEGLLRPARRRGRWLAAAAALFAAGLLLGFFARAPRAEAAGPRYLLLLESGTETGPEAPHVAAIVDWAQRQRAAGVTLSGAKLAAEGFVLTAGGTEALAAGAASLGGYFVVGAHDDDEALRIARSHPLLGWGGRVVVRRIE